MINSAAIYKLPCGDTEVVLLDVDGGTVTLTDLRPVEAEIIVVLHDYAVRKKDYEPGPYVETYSLFFEEA